jgi:PleD family two-component response regulator
MAGMSAEEVTLILGVLVVVVAGAITWGAIARGRASGLKISVAKLLDVQVSVGAETREAVGDDVRAAAAARGQTLDATVLKVPASIRFGRILWVDEHPDNNLHESIAFERLGLAVTKTTYADGAMAYLKSLRYDVVITNWGRQDGTPVPDFVRQVVSSYSDVTVIVYTSPAQVRTGDAHRSGADVVTADPQKLLGSVLARLSSAS